MRLTVYAAGAAGLLLVAALLGWHWHTGQQAVWDAKLAAMVEARKAADNVAKAAEKGIDVEKRRVAQLAQQVERLERRRIPSRVIRDTLTVPSEVCDSVVQPLLGQLEIRDSLLELKDTAIASYDRINVYVGQQLVAARVRVAELEHVVRRPTRKWYVPKVGVGGSCGVAAGGGFDCVAGPTLSWSF
jgi:hypothetical protein